MKAYSSSFFADKDLLKYNLEVFANFVMHYIYAFTVKVKVTVKSKKEN